MYRKALTFCAVIGSVAVTQMPAAAQQAAEPAPPAAGENIPPVDVVQKPKAAKAQAAKKAPAKKKSVAKSAPVEPVPQAPSEAAEFDPSDDASQASETARTYPAGGQGAAARAQNGPFSPIDPSRGIAPGDLSKFPGAATRASLADIEEQRPKDNHEILARIPGVTTVNDDGMARHSGIGIRGAPARRSRKVLVMEDGQPINFSTYLDPSTHYTPPTDRVESVEVIKGAVTAHGPLNNHGVVNFRNLSPFGTNETVVSAAIGHVEGANKDIANMRHVHTRQNLGNVGVVASYSGAESGGAWDNEILRYNDFYGALGFKGTNQDLTISGGFFRQRDRYDELNYEGSDADFFRNKRRKADPLINGFESPYGYQFSSYNADYYKMQVAHNYYIDSDTTVSTRLFGSDHHRARFFPDFEEGDPFLMGGRDRRYKTYGADSRVELARRSFFGLRQDIQAGVRYERQTLANIDREGEEDEILDFDNKGSVDSDTRLNANAYTAFLQTSIHVTSNFIVTPGIRYEGFDVSAREAVGGDGLSAKSDHDIVLPALSFAWEAMPLTTVYGGYHRGFAPHVTRDVALDNFPLAEEIGDNFQIGARSTAVRGLAFDMAYFHSRIEDYQIKEAFTDQDGNNVYGTMDEVRINGFEIGARLESRPLTGGPWNFYGEATYTYARSIIEKGFDDPDEDDPLPLESVAGNRLPETPEHWAYLTLGTAHRSGWDASVSYTYIGDFFVDTFNSPHVDEGDLGLVEDVWLLSARVNYKIPNTNLTLFASGQNLTDEFYMADRSDGAKPGQGRTLWGGFKYKF